MSNPISNDFTLTYDLEVADTGKTRRKHRAGEVMSNFYDVVNRLVVSDTEPDAADRFTGQMWYDTVNDVLWLCTKSLEFDRQIG